MSLLLLTLFACTDTSDSGPKDTADTGSPDDTGESGDTGDTGDTTDTGETGDTTAPPDMKISLPGYIAPGSADWATLISDAEHLGYVVISPDLGPGTTVSTEWLTQIRALQDAGIKVLGFVSTEYGGRAQADVESDINNWVDWYEVDGIYFDAAPADDKCDGAQAQYMAEAGLARSLIPEARIAVAWDFLPCESWIADIDAAVTFQGTGSDFLTWEPPEFIKNYPADRFWVIVSSLPKDDLDAAISHAQERNVAQFYGTDAALPTAWAQLPTYWTDEVLAIQQ